MLLVRHRQIGNEDGKGGPQVAIGVMNWVWTYSRSRHGARLVLLAIADCASGDGSNAWPSNKELQRKTNLTERAVRTSVAELIEMGELAVDFNTGPGGCNRYRVIMATPPANSAPGKDCPPAENAPRQDLPPSESAQLNGHASADFAPLAENAPGQDLPQPGAKNTPVTVLEPSLNSPTESSSKRRRATRIPDDFAVTDEMAQWARENVPELIRLGRGKRETDKFINYWHAKSGKDATKLDWNATWRNWMLSAEERLTPAFAPAADRREQAHVARTSRAFERAAAREANS